MKKFELFVGTRYFRSKKGNKFISFITGLSVFGIAIGVMVIITVLSVMNGFQTTIRDRMINTGFHVYMTSYGKTSLLYNYKNKVDKIKEKFDVDVVSPFFKGQVLAKSTMQRIMAVDFQGIEKDLDKIDTSFAKTVKIIKGEFDLTERDNILIGSELAYYLDVDINDKIDIISPQGGEKLIVGRIAPIMRKFRITGIFKTDHYEIDMKMAFSSLSSAQDLFNKPGAAWGIGMKIRDIYDAPVLARDIQLFFKNQFQVFTWMDINHNLFAALKMEKTIMAVVVFLITIVAAFCIISNLVMIVMDKKKEIAVLKTFGATSAQIVKIFTFTGLTMGVTGIIIGLVTGLLTSYNFQRILKFIELVVNKFNILWYKFISLFIYRPMPAKFELMPSDIYYLDGFPVDVVFWDVFWVCLGAFIVVFLSSFLPARQAAKFKPMELIRYE